MNKSYILAILKKVISTGETYKASTQKQNLHLIKSVLMEIIAVDPSSKPPKRWWGKMHKQVKSNNPNYTEEQIRQTIGAGDTGAKIPQASPGTGAVDVS